MAIFDCSVNAGGKIDFQAAPTVVWPASRMMQSSTIFWMTETTGVVVPVTAFLSKLMATRPGHLFPGPGVIGVVAAANALE
jgi:hypothetical protein